MATDLQTIPMKSRTSASVLPLSSTLSALVDGNTPASSFPALSDSDLSEVRGAIAALEAANTPADPDEVSRMVGKISVIFPGGKLSQAEAEAQNQLYAELLADIPQDVLSQAFRKCAQTLKFFPTVAEIRSAAGPEMAIRSWRLMRLKSLALAAERQGPMKADEPYATPEQAKEIKAELGIEGNALLERVIGSLAA